MWRRRAPRRVREKLGRVWRDHPRIAPLRHLGRRSLSLGRYGLRGVLSARHAGSIARTDWGWELDREVVAAARSRQKAFGWFRQGRQRAGNGGELRSRPDTVLGDAAAGHLRYLRDYRGALGELAAARSGRRDRNAGR